MNLPILDKLKSRLMPLVGCFAVVAALAGCGSGTGESAANQPAPQTFNGLVITLFAGGPTFTFVRADGDAMKGVETGAVIINDNPGGAVGTTSAGAPFLFIPPTTTSGVRYTYVRTSPEGGTVTLTGTSSGVPSSNALFGTPPLPPNYLMPDFARQMDLLFGTDGNIINGVTINDSGEGIDFPGLLWVDGTLRQVGNIAVPIGYNLEQSSTARIPKVYPESVNTQSFEVIPDDPAEDSLNHQFLNSVFTRFSDRSGDFIEEGIGNRNVIGESVLTLINFDYAPDPNSVNLARVRIFDSPGGSPAVYFLTFLDFEKGTYVRENGTTGVFEFPFLD